MPTIYGLIGLTDTEYRNVRDFDKSVTYEAINTYVDLVNSVAGTTMSMFVDGVPTITPTDIHELHGSGEMDIVADGAEYPPIAVTGTFETQYPIFNVGQRLNINRIDAAKMTVQQLDKSVRAIATRYTNARTNQALRAIFRNTTYSVLDRDFGTLSIKPLANNDGTVYPAGTLNPSAGTRSTLQAYNVSGSASLAKADFTNSYSYLSDTYGDMNGGIGVVSFVNPQMEEDVRGISGFIPVQVSDVINNANAEYIASYPELTGMQGRPIGRVGNCNIWSWSKMPNDYLFSMYPSADKPVKMRVDAEAELGRGNLQILTNMSEIDDPTIRLSQWAARFGYGVANRLNGYVVQIKASGDYDIPVFAN